MCTHTCARTDTHTPCTHIYKILIETFPPGGRRGDHKNLEVPKVTKFMRSRLYKQETIIRQRRFFQNRAACKLYLKLLGDFLSHHPCWGEPSADATVFELPMLLKVTPRNSLAHEARFG